MVDSKPGHKTHGVCVCVCVCVCLFGRADGRLSCSFARVCVSAMHIISTFGLKPERVPYCSVMYCNRQEHYQEEY